MLLKLAARNWRTHSYLCSTSRQIHSFRLLSSSSHPYRNEVVAVPVGGKGHVDLKITSPKSSVQSQNVLVCLPAGPCPHDHASTASTDASDQLAKHFPDTTIVDLQYRLAAKDGSQTDHRFPTPIHDIFTAWDEIYQQACGRSVEQSTEKNVQNEHKICLYGSHIGGALALSLALTNPDQVHAVAVKDPLVDWPILDEIASEASKTSKTRKNEKREALGTAAQALIKLRTHLFRSPSGYFDPFASPTLFLRAPGRDTPLTKTAAPEVLVEQFDGAPIRYGDEEDEVGVVDYGRDDYGPYDDDWHATEIEKIRKKEYRIDRDSDVPSTPSESPVNSSSNDTSDSNTVSSTTSNIIVPARRRKVLRRWPPVGYSEEATLPYVNVILTQPCLATSGVAAGTDISPVTRLQGRELVDLLRRACFWGRDKAFAEERVVLTDRQQLAEIEADFDTTMTWLRNRFQND